MVSEKPEISIVTGTILNILTMFRKNKLWAYFLPISLITFAVIFTYSGLIRVFYQQDEWNTLGNMLINGPKAFLAGFSPGMILLGSGRPFSILPQYLIYKNFPFNPVPLAVFSIILHTFNSILIYLLFLLVLKKPIPAFLGAFFFAVAAVPSQAVTWFAANTTTLPSAALALLAIIVVIRSKPLLKNSFITVGLALSSYYFKENTIVIFPLLLFMALYRHKQKHTKFAHLWPYIALSIYGLITMIGRFFIHGQSNIYETLLVNNNLSTGMSYIIRTVFYPMFFFFQVFVPREYMFQAADRLISLNYPVLVNTPWLKEFVVSDMISLFGFGVIIFILYNLYLNNLKERPLVTCLVIMSLVSFLPFAITNRGSSYMEFRYYYFPAIGLSGISSLIINGTIQKLSNYRWRMLGITAVLFLFIFYLKLNISTVRNYIRSDQKIAVERLGILNKISEIKSTLPDKPVFLITRKGGYLEDYVSLPFQQGIGYTLMIWLYDTKKIPDQLISEHFLWGLSHQGYKESDGRGFGYFNNYEDLLNSYKSNQITTDQVLAFHYLYEQKQLLNTTDETRQKLIKSAAP